MDEISAAKLPFNLKILPVNKDGIPNGVPFLAMFNPESIAINETVNWSTKNARGKQGTDPVYKGTKPRSFSLELTIDGTGVNTNGVKIPVTAQVLLFRAATTTIIGSVHRPPYVIVQYGLFICNCVLTSSSVTYTMFDMTGLPIRAKINASFTERTPAGLGGLLSMLSSPDLTHKVVVKQGDILPTLTYQTYNNQTYYLQVAKVNKLKNFRKLQAGTTLVFPPVSDK
jgi:hypothetical protein